MQLGILSSGTGWHVRDLLRAAGELGHVARPMDFRRVTATVGEPVLSSIASAVEQTDLSGLDTLVVRTMPPGSLEQVVFRMDALHAAEQRGVRVLNPARSLEICVDKYLALERLRRAGLRVPPTFVCQDADSALQAFEALGRDVVVKPIFGSEGRGMLRVQDPELAWRTFRTLERTQAVLYLQQFIRHPGWDLRAFVLEGRILAGMRRVSSGDWRTNVAQGALAEPATLNEEQQEMVLRAADAVGTIAAGVDLLPGPAGEFFVIEVNAVPGWHALSRTTGIDVAREIILALERWNR